ncbi:MAG: hypothetical protein ACRDJV_05250 [Actinomycetota bacterium]
MDIPKTDRSRPLTVYRSGYTPEHGERLRKIHERLIEARRELDALIGDAYLRPRANIVPVHFLDLASAVEKLRWAEKEWRELDRELAGQQRPSEPHLAAARDAGAGGHTGASQDEEESEEPHPEGAIVEAIPSRSNAS